MSRFKYHHRQVERNPFPSILATHIKDEILQPFHAILFKYLKISHEYFVCSQSFGENLYLVTEKASTSRQIRIKAFVAGGYTIFFSKR